MRLGTGLVRREDAQAGGSLIGSIVFPVKQLVKLCKEYGVMSLVDAAHAVGQVEVDIKTIDPDFWISVRLVLPSLGTVAANDSVLMKEPSHQKM